MSGNNEIGHFFYEPPLSNEGNTTSIDILRQHASITTLFLDFYKEREYQIIDQGNVLEDGDNSVIFTGATITPLKGYLETGVPFPGIGLVQKCLRTKRLDEMYDLNSFPEWTHYFTMCGILSAPNRIGELTDEAFVLLTEKLRIPKGNLAIESHSFDRDLSQPWREKGVEIQEEAYQSENYRWKYGIPNLYGRGINILLKDTRNNTFRELGNIVNIENQDGKPIASEFGFGLESLLSTLYGCKKPMEASSISTIVPYQEGIQEKLLDALTASIVIYHQGIEPGKGKEKHVLKRLVKGLSYIRRNMGVSVERIVEIGNRFEEIEFGDYRSCGDKLAEGILSYENQLEKFDSYSSNQLHALLLRGEERQKLSDKLRRVGSNMGILPVDVEETLKSLQLNNA